MAWLGNWSNRKNITVKHSKLATDQTHFPVLVVVSCDTDLFGELGFGEGKKVSL